MNENDQKKVALVTGAASGIGRASALAFARTGAKVVVADVHADEGREAARQIEEQGGQAFFVEADVSRADDVASLIHTTVKVFGRLDYAHNNAGIIGDLANVADGSEANWDRVIACNLKGVWLCMKYEIEQMLKQGGGAIVNTSSIWGLVGTGMGASAYVASKHGVAGLTRAAALEYAKSNIRVNAVCPGAVRTPFTQRVFDLRPGSEDYAIALEPVGRLGEPDEIAAAVVWLCSDAASFVVGSTISVDGGMAAI